MIYFLIVISASLLIISCIVHVITFTSYCIQESIPFIWLLHILIFAVFVPAILYSKKFEKQANEIKDFMLKVAPKWIMILASVFFFYALINFFLFVTLNEGGSPTKRDNKYYLTTHGNIIREINQKEFYKYKNITLRGFSGHWMLFYCVSLAMLVTYLKLLRAQQAGNLEQLITSVRKDDEKEEEQENATETKIKEQLPPTAEIPYYGQPASCKEGLLSLFFLLAVIAFILTSTPILNLFAAIICFISAFLHVKRKASFTEKSFESLSGCILIAPAFFLSIAMAASVRSTIIVWIQKGMVPALTGQITMVSSANRAYLLSSGESANPLLSGSTLFLVTFPVAAAGTWGLAYLAEVFGRYLEKNMFK